MNRKIMQLLSYLNIGIQDWIYMLGSAFLEAQKIFTVVWKTTIMPWSSEATLSGGETKEERF